MAKSATVDVDGHSLKLTNLDKVLYPRAGFTKAHVIDYYRAIAPVLLPHLADRALTLKRYPNGVEGAFFYEKESPAHRPDFVRTAPVWSEGRGGDIHYTVVDSLATLLWLANIADLELHTFLARAESPLEPTCMVYDLDPGAPADVLDCCDVALRLRGFFRDLGLECYPKTSGSKGMQLYVPLNVPGLTFDDTKPFARAVGELVEQEMPARVTTNMAKAERPGKVLIDWSQNDDHKTTVCVYSLRAKEQPTVSTPLTWHEVEEASERRDAAKLRFLPADVLKRVAGLGDLFADVLTLEQPLPALV